MQNLPGTWNLVNFRINLFAIYCPYENVKIRTLIPYISSVQNNGESGGIMSDQKNEQKRTKGFMSVTDTETSGFSATQNQILEYADRIIDEETGTLVEKNTLKLKRKPGKPISPIALMVNNINPYSKSWAAEAVSEADLVKHIQRTSDKYTVKNQDGVMKMKFSAYNAPFDKSMIGVAINRMGGKFAENYNKSSVDILPMARSAVKKGLINIEKTAQKSCKQTDIAQALGIDVGNRAHTADGDTEVAQQIYEKVSQLTRGKSPYGAEAPVCSQFNAGEIYNVTSNSAKSGIKKRHLYVLDNDLENQKIIAVDGDSLKEFYAKRTENSNGDPKATKANEELFGKVFREFNYATIIEESPVEPEELKKITDFTNAFPVIVQDRKESIQKKILERQEGRRYDAFDQEIGNFDLVKHIEESVSSGVMSKAECREELMEIYRMAGDVDEATAKITVAGLMTKAHEYSLSLGKEGFKESSWSVDNITSALLGFNKIDKDLAAGEFNPEFATEGQKGVSSLLLELKHLYPRTFKEGTFSNIEKIEPFLDNDLEFEDETTALTIEEDFSIELDDLLKAELEKNALKEKEAAEKEAQKEIDKAKKAQEKEEEKARSKKEKEIEKIKEKNKNREVIDISTSKVTKSHKYCTVCGKPLVSKRSKNIGVGCDCINQFSSEAQELIKKANG